MGSVTEPEANVVFPLTPGGMHAALQRHCLDAWFPRCLDREHGGFLCDFDHRWRPVGPQDKMLEFQARQTRVAALGCRLHPGDAMWADACRRGFDVLREMLWDHEHGGWFVTAERDGRIRDTTAKHLHGMAYATQACLDVARSIDAPGALALAREAFDWIDANAWDPVHGLYWGWLARDGTPIGVGPAAAPRDRDHLGHPPGVKDINTNGDMLELLTEFLRTDGPGRAGDRLERMVVRFDLWATRTGRLPVQFSRALEPIGRIGPGYEVQASWRLPLARAALGGPLTFGPVERALRASACGDPGPTGGVRGMEGREEWWIQFELLRSLVFEAAVLPVETARATAAAAGQMTYLERVFLDRRWGGVRRFPRRWLRPDAKGDVWKDASHEVMALAAAALYLRPRTGPFRAEDDPWP